MKYYQDFIASENKQLFILEAIEEWKNTKIYQTSLIAEKYDRNENVTIKTFQKFLYSTNGCKYPDIMAANNKIATNEFNKLLTWSVQYSLANGINYLNKDIDNEVGKQIDTDTAKALRLAMRDGVVFVYYDGTKLVPFTVSQFVPLYDENTGELKAGIRFYRIDENKTLNIWLYEQDGVSYYRQEKDKKFLMVIKEKVAYKNKIKNTQADGILDIEGENYNSLPIIKLKSNDYEMSFLNYVRDKIDSYDLTLSGFANDIDENAFVYWIIKNSGGMDETDLARFKQHLKTSKTAVIDTEDGGGVDHFTKDVPTEARTKYLDRIMSEIYSAWMAVDMSKLSSGAVNEMQINAMYSNADNRASELEYNLRNFVKKLLEFKNITISDYEITFIRNKLTSELQQAQINQINTNIIATMSAELNDENILTALKNSVSIFNDINVDEILKQKGEEVLELSPPEQQEEIEEDIDVTQEVQE